MSDASDSEPTAGARARRWFGDLSWIQKFAVIVIPLAFLSVWFSDTTSNGETGESPTRSSEVTSTISGAEVAYSAECGAAFADAAAVSDMQDTHEDMDPAFSACATMAAFASASEAYPAALDGADPTTYAFNRCQFSPNTSVTESSICNELSG